MWDQLTDPLFLAGLRHLAEWIVQAAFLCIFIASIVRSGRPIPHRREAEELNASIRGMLQVFSRIASRR
jgi:hypothetical protein